MALIPRARRIAAAAVCVAAVCVAAGALTLVPLQLAQGLVVYGGALPLYGAGGCVRDISRQAPSERRCPGAVAGLRGAGSLALSPDQRNLYVAAPDDGAVVALTRVPTTGGLHPPVSRTSRSCVSAGGAGGCAVSDPALYGADAIAVSPDGRFVYVGGRDSAAISAFARGRGGLLRPLPQQIPAPKGGHNGPSEFGCISGYQLSGSPDPRCPVHQNALVAISSLAISLDGRDVYAVSYGLAPGEDSIVAMARDPRTGGLSPLRGAGGCYQSRPVSKCSRSTPGLEGARDVLVTPDGRFVYVASDTSSAVAAFARNRQTGRLIPLGCVSSSSTRPAPARDDAPCSVTAPQLGGARSLALSPDGRQLYVAAFDPGSIVALDRDPASGRLTPIAGPPLCLQAMPDPECAAGIPSLHGASAVAVSPSGATVWVACEGANSIVALRRDPLTGRLSLLTGSPTAGVPLASPDALVVTADGRDLYAASPFDDAVAGAATG